MSVRRMASRQPESFEFRPETEEKFKLWLKKYPESRKQSVVIPALWLAQKDNKGWLSRAALEMVANRLEMPFIRVYEVATFYTMFNLKPVGRYFIQLCGTTPCQLRGAESLKSLCQNKIGPSGQVDSEGLFSWAEVECLGACVNAPMVQINDDYYEDLTKESFAALLEDLRQGKKVNTGSQKGRQTSAPEKGIKSLLDSSLYDGSKGKKLKTLPKALKK